MSNWLEGRVAARKAWTDKLHSIEVDAPGLSSSNLERFAFTRVRRPIFPLDPEATYP